MADSNTVQLKKSPAAPLREVPFKITNPERIPTERYYDEEFFRLENEHLWPHVWQMACRLEEIPEVGDFVEYEILDKSVLVVRTKSGIKAFHNACRHRGVQIAKGHGNCKSQGFICPFHGWRWNLDGQNTYVHEPSLFSPENLEKAELNLVPCRVETWGGCAFINFDDNAAPLLDCIGPLKDRFDVRNVDKLKIEWWVATVLPTNWKLAMEAFMEGFHVMKTHPQLHKASTPVTHKYAGDGNTTPAARNATARETIDIAIKHMKLLSKGMGGMIHANDIAVAESIRDIEVPEDPAKAMSHWFKHLNEEITVRSRARGVDMPDLNQLAANNPAGAVEFIFPHYFLLPQFGNASSYRIRPLTPETCLFELYSLVLYPEGEKRPRPVAPEPMPYNSPDFPEIPRQDYSNLPLQQLGLHAKGFEYMRLAKDVEGLISNYQRLIDGFIEGVEQDKLVQATRTVCTKLDSPIADIGF